jgi:hypothetical protein
MTQRVSQCHTGFLCLLFTMSKLKLVSSRKNAASLGVSLVPLGVSVRTRQLVMTETPSPAAKVEASLERSLVETKKSAHVKGTRSDPESSSRDSGHEIGAILRLPLIKLPHLHMHLHLHLMETVSALAFMLMQQGM